MYGNGVVTIRQNKLNTAVGDCLQVVAKPCLRSGCSWRIGIQSTNFSHHLHSAAHRTTSGGYNHSSSKSEGRPDVQRHLALFHEGRHDKADVDGRLIRHAIAHERGVETAEVVTAVGLHTEGAAQERGRPSLGSDVGLTK